MKKRRWIPVLLCVLLVLTGTAGVRATEPEEITPAWENREMLLAGLYEADITSMREAMDLGLLTSTDLTAYYLERIETYNETYNCFITLCDDALEIAAERDAAIEAGTAKGKLFGIPVVVKDNIDVAGWHTTNGYTKSSGQIAESNAAIVEYLLQEGAVILGKTNMSTEAQDAYITSSAAVGETHNAYNTTMASGGSSGGSAVAVSLNFAPAGLGTDTNSSLRYPAALNGCVSLRSTFGRLSLDGVIQLNNTRDVSGVITRTVQDQALMLDVLSGGETQYAENLDPNALKGLRIGILDEMTYAVGGRAQSSIDPEITAAFEAAVQEMEACGAEIVHVEPQGLIDLSTATHSTNASSLKEKVYNTFLNALEEYEIAAVIYPTYVTAPLRSGRDENGTYWSPYDQPYINNCRLLSPSSGAPEITVPLGVHSRGAGMGMEICAPKNEEQLLLNIAYAYMLQYDHRETPADAADLYGESCVGTLGEILQAREEELAQIEAEQLKTEEEEKEKAEEEKKSDAEQKAEIPEEPGAEMITAPVEPTPENTGQEIWLWCAGGALCVAVLALGTWWIVRGVKQRHRMKHGRQRKPGVIYPAEPEEEPENQTD